MRDAVSYVDPKPELEAISTFLRSFLLKLSQLQPGKRLVLPGGWASKAGGHAIMHTVEREATPEAHYAFVVTNTGAYLLLKPTSFVCIGEGSQYHPRNSTSYPKIKQRSSIRFGSIPARFIECTYHIYVIL